MIPQSGVKLLDFNKALTTYIEKHNCFGYEYLLTVIWRDTILSSQVKDFYNISKIG